MSPSTANGHSQVQEPEFQQAAHEIEASLGPLFEKNPAYKRVFELCKIPERIIQFRVTWEDDKGVCQFNNGYRVQFNSALGPYKGGLRFHPSVNLSILKFLGFEQIFKNALTGLQMGGGKGGADFDPKGKSDNEIRKFCEAFMRELSRHIGDRTDVPAGDIGVGGREVAYMYGSYLRSRNEFAGILTGKGLTFGGSLIRNEATGYGLVYYVQHMIATREGIPLEETFKGRRVILSGSGNVSQFAALKVIELGGKVLALSDSTGSLISENDEGFTVADIEKIAQIKLARKSLTAAGLDTFKWVEGSRPWTLFEKVDIALPGATQNEVNEEEAKALVKAGCRYVAEGSNMGSTQEAINVFEDARKSGNMSDKSLWYAPGKASNAGGVAVSGLEMQQNASFGRWTSEEVDAKLKDIMATIFSQGYETGKEYTKGNGVPSLVDGSNISGFKRVVDAMYAQGSWW